MTKPSKKSPRSGATNRKALRDYTVLSRIEAGIELVGTEVKSVRQGGTTLTGGYASAEGEELFLHDVHIPVYEHGNRFNHDPNRIRRLLLHKKEIGRLIGQMGQKGYALIPLGLYFRGRNVKIELGLCKGKQVRDKRDSIKRREANREAERAMKRK